MSNTCTSRRHGLHKEAAVAVAVAVATACGGLDPKDQISKRSTADPLGTRTGEDARSFGPDETIDDGHGDSATDRNAIRPQRDESTGASDVPQENTVTGTAVTEAASQIAPTIQTSQPEAAPTTEPSDETPAAETESTAPQPAESTTTPKIPAVDPTVTVRLPPPTPSVPSEPTPNPVVHDPSELILLPAATQARLRQQALDLDPQWVAFRSRLDQNLSVVIGPGAYQGSQLSWLADYALGYQVLKTLDPTTATHYAQKGLALLKSALRDLQKGGSVARQYIGRGDGTTKSFTMPHSDIDPTTLSVYKAAVTTMAVTRGATPQDAIYYYMRFLKVSNTPDGAPDYREGIDWRHNPDLEHNLLDWSLPGREPTLGATYHVTMTSGLGETTYVPSTAYVRDQAALTFAVAPSANEAIYVQYIYRLPLADGSFLEHQQTSDGSGGFNSIFIDTTYTSRYLGKYVALGYNWLSGFVGLDADLRVEAEDLLVRWSDFVRDRGYARNSPGSNYGAGGYVSRVLAALALPSQHPQSARLLTEGTDYRERYVVPLLENDTQSVKGGYWAEGWNYGQLATINLLLAGLALECNGALVDATAERRWAGDVVRHLLSASPTPATLFDGGDWYSYPVPFPQKNLFYVLSGAVRDPLVHSYTNYVIQNYSGRQTGDYLDVLFRDPSADQGFWSDAPLQHLAEGQGLLTARSDWGSAPTWLSFQVGNLLKADHQDASPGQLTIRRGPNDLLVNANAIGGNQSSTRSTFSNSVVIDDQGERAQSYRFSAGYSYGTPGVVIKVYETGSEYVYVSGDYRAAYSLPSNPGGGGSAAELTREIVYLRPNLVVVYDRATTTKDYYSKHLRWHFATAPIVSGQAFIATAGMSKLFGRTHSTVPLTTTLSPVQVGTATVQQLVTENGSPTAHVAYVTGLQIAASTTTEMLPTNHIASRDGQFEGLHFGDRVVLFSSVGGSASGLAYQLDTAGSVDHLLTGCEPGHSYRVSMNGTFLVRVTASAQGTVRFSSMSQGIVTVELGSETM